MEDNTAVITEVHNVLGEQTRYIALDRKSDRYGFIDPAGQWLIKPRWVQVQDSVVADIYTLFTLKKSPATLNRTCRKCATNSPISPLAATNS